MPADVWSHTTGSSMLPLNAYSHLAGTFDGSSLKLYVNGVLVGTRTFTGPMPIGTGPRRIGGHSLGQQFFKGTIDEVRIFNRALSQAEIQADINATTPLAVSAVTPAAGASGVVQSTALTATFNQPMTVASVNG